MAEAKPMRLIDANAADVERIPCFYGDACHSDDVQSWLDEQPTIDAVPVVHARWVPNHGSYGTPHCSNCKWRIPYSEDSTLDARSFCPNCGAIMDGGAK